MRTYDIVLANIDEFFSARIREFSAQAGPSFFLAEPVWVEELLGRVEAGDIGVRMLIDMASDCYREGDPYYHLACTVKGAGGYVINDPDRSPTTTHKARFHKVLLQHGLPVPDTIIVDRVSLSTFRVTDELVAHVGTPFVVKPGWGGGNEGVVLNARAETDLQASAAAVPTSDSFLVQRHVTAKQLDGHIAWLRVFYFCGEVIPCWLEPPRNEYRLVTPSQRRDYGRAPLTSLTLDIARISGMEFFSSELALTESGQFVIVDYLNDACDMHPKSVWPMGVPDEVVRRIASKLVARTAAVTGKGPFDDEVAERDRDWQTRRLSGRLAPGE